MDKKLLKTLSETPGVPGREEPIRAVVKDELSARTDELKVDAMGNLIALKKECVTRILAPGCQQPFFKRSLFPGSEQWVLAIDDFLQTCQDRNTNRRPFIGFAYRHHRKLLLTSGFAISG